MPWRVRSGSPAETVLFGCRLGRLLACGDVVFLHGPLGAGKTRLVEGIARGLGAAGVRSPSFTLLHSYRGRLPVYHADLYRLTDPDEAAALNLSEVTADGVLLVEWPELVEVEFPARLSVCLSFMAGDEDARLLTLVPRGERYEAITRAMEERFAGPRI
ncbi:MAG: tRNA (adenosine(37)-N6)-threonylcarbamoyltransferase complex ATPase subunit type 1 TsaE [Firmicutes bacterium]|nr:tRNA (adenosine(37)-N6)-threonylcarbamoyltransferase complex ATPase subunit type 1 TsaE [Bacillota bacterium]